MSVRLARTLELLWTWICRRGMRALRCRGGWLWKCGGKKGGWRFVNHTVMWREEGRRVLETGGEVGAWDYGGEFGGGGVGWEGRTCA